MNCYGIVLIWIFQVIYCYLPIYGQKVLKYFNNYFMNCNGIVEN